MSSLLKVVASEPAESYPLWNLFVRSYKVVVEGTDRKLRKLFGLSMAEFELLVIVADCGGRVRFVDLAKILLLSESRVSRQVANLKSKGLVQRQVTDSDRRATFAIITPLGLKKLEEARVEFINSNRTLFFDRIPADQQEAMMNLLRGILSPNDDFFEKRAQRVIELRGESERENARAEP